MEKVAIAFRVIELFLELFGYIAGVCESFLLCPEWFLFIFSRLVRL